MPCNKVGVDVHHHIGYSKVEVWLDANTIRDISAIGGGGASITAIIEYYSGKEIIAAALSSTATAVLAAITVAYWTWILQANDGCGVKLNYYFTPPATSWGIVVNSQQP